MARTELSSSSIDPFIPSVLAEMETGAAPETVDAWQDYARRGELKAAILEVMEGINADMRRRALT